MLHCLFSRPPPLSNSHNSHAGAWMSVRVRVAFSILPWHWDSTGYVQGLRKKNLSHSKPFVKVTSMFPPMIRHVWCYTCTNYKQFWWDIQKSCLWHFWIPDSLYSRLGPGDQVLILSTFLRLIFRCYTLERCDMVFIVLSGTDMHVHQYRYKPRDIILHVV